ncbi:hypothetical protein MKZ38_004414 [Zalerion maritima]|uniref:Uncharacterized protein n=1 Tax=Zalerion maritima TaxID=339359 RepID=A0AAD5RLA9_9PEZI|nr:hypothetical protein MKZ38_004414 [Zalerion maritima]
MDAPQVKRERDGSFPAVSPHSCARRVIDDHGENNNDNSTLLPRSAKRIRKAATTSASTSAPSGIGEDEDSNASVAEVVIPPPPASVLGEIHAISTRLSGATASTEAKAYEEMCRLGDSIRSGYIAAVDARKRASQAAQLASEKYRTAPRPSKNLKPRCEASKTELRKGQELIRGIEAKLGAGSAVESTKEKELLRETVEFLRTTVLPDKAAKFKRLSDRFDRACGKRRDAKHRASAASQRYREAKAREVGYVAEQSRIDSCMACLESRPPARVDPPGGDRATNLGNLKAVALEVLNWIEVGEYYECVDLSV